MIDTLFGKKTIRSRVLSVIESRIQSAQDQHEEECEEIDRKAEEQKEASADRLVNSIVGRVI